MKIMNQNFKIQYDKTKPDGTPRKLLDISLAKKYNWKPKFDLMEALRTTVKDFEKIMEIIKKLNFKFILLLFFFSLFSSRWIKLFFKWFSNYRQSRNIILDFFFQYLFLIILRI